MGNNKKKSKASSNGSRPRNGASRTGNGDVATAAIGRRVERSSTSAPSQHTRSYSIPDYRLEHPDFTVRQVSERDRQGQEQVRYEVEGDLSAPVPPIRDSKY